MKNLGPISPRKLVRQTENTALWSKGWFSSLSPYPINRSCAGTETTYFPLPPQGEGACDTLEEFCKKNRDGPLFNAQQAQRKI